MYIVTASETTPPARVIISGRSLAHRKMSAGQKAALAAEILSGEVAIKLSVRQLSQLIGVSAPYIKSAGRLTKAKRASLASGTDMGYRVFANSKRWRDLLPPLNAASA
jgi:hypothetical protein